MSPLTIDFGQGNQLGKSGKSQGKVREIRILKLVATLQLLSVRDACLQKNSGLQKRHSRSSLKMDCVVHPVAPGPPLSTWSPRKTDHGESAEIFAGSTQSPCLINIPCHIYTIFRQTFSEKPYFRNSIYRWLSIKFL